MFTSRQHPYSEQAPSLWKGLEASVCMFYFSILRYFSSLIYFGGDPEYLSRILQDQYRCTVPELWEHRWESSVGLHHDLKPRLQVYVSSRIQGVVAGLGCCRVPSVCLAASTMSGLQVSKGVHLSVAQLAADVRPVRFGSDITKYSFYPI